MRTLTESEMALVAGGDLRAVGDPSSLSPHADEFIEISQEAQSACEHGVNSATHSTTTSTEVGANISLGEKGGGLSGGQNDYIRRLFQVPSTASPIRRLFFRQPFLRRLVVAQTRRRLAATLALAGCLSCPWAAATENETASVAGGDVQTVNGPSSLSPHADEFIKMSQEAQSVCEHGVASVTHSSTTSTKGDANISVGEKGGGIPEGTTSAFEGSFKCYPPPPPSGGSCSDNPSPGG